MKMHFTKMLSVCCVFLLGVFSTTGVSAQGNTCETATAASVGLNTADGPADGVSSDICESTAGDFADWYSWTAPDDGELNVNSCFGGVDTQLSIFTGPCVDLTCAGSNDDSCPLTEGGSSWASSVTIDVTSGTTYLIQFDNDWSTSGFDWNLNFVAAGTPDCEGVPDGPAVPGTACDDLDETTFDDIYQDDCSCAGTPFDCPELLANNGDACDDGLDTTFDDVVTDCVCAGTPFDCPELLANNGDACDDGDATTFGDVITDCECAGTPAAMGEICSMPFAMVPGVNTAPGPASGASSDICESTAGEFANWYAWTAPADGELNVNSCLGGVDTQLSIFSGSCDALVCEGSNDDDCPLSEGGSAWASSVTIDVTEGVEYLVQWDNDWSTSGFDFNVNFTPAEPECGDEGFEFPAVVEESISTMEVEGGYMLSWAPVPGQIGCQLQGRPVGGERTNRRIMGEDAGSFFQPMGGLEPATTYQWRVRCGCAEDVRGPWSSIQTFTTPGEVVAIASQPNPTNGPSVVTFSSTVESYVTLEVYDMSGRLIDGIFAGNVQSNNEYRFEFDGTFLPNGVYIYRLTTDTEVINEKFMIAK